MILKTMVSMLLLLRTLKKCVWRESKLSWMTRKQIRVFVGLFESIYRDELLHTKAFKVIAGAEYYQIAWKEPS